MPTPEDQARETIDALLTQAGWVIQDANQVNLTVARGVVIRNFPLVQGRGFADYLFYVDGKAAGVIEAKREGATLTGVEIQSAKYSGGFPPPYPSMCDHSLFCTKAQELKPGLPTNLIPTLAAARLLPFTDRKLWPNGWRKPG